MLTIVQAETQGHIAAAREMMLEYQAELGISLCFQNFDEELRTLPGKYAPPAGRLLLAEVEGRSAGMIALRPVDENGACEMKRLYVRPDFRGHAAGRALVDELIAQARSIGYHRMRLDTIQGKMDRAIALYRVLGFREIAPYYNSPVKETLFLELDFTRGQRLAVGPQT
ncbi:MAG TPA: GNAT family N-acetyltransferase [Candidatus Angelobacter sp.]|nr:GNAT family N-acetyltransferase [Candidatus Angelobacter sp.]